MLIQKNIHSYIHILCWIHENLTQKRGWKTACRGWVLKHIQVCFYTEHYAFGKHRVWNNTPVHVLAFPVMLPNQQTQPTATITRNKSLAWKGAGSPFGLEPDNSCRQKCKWAGLLCFTEPQVPGTTLKTVTEHFLADGKSLPYPQKERHQWQYFVEQHFFLICCISDTARCDRLDGKLQQSISISWISGTPLDS